MHGETLKFEKYKCSETSAYKIQTLGNYPEGNIQRLEYFCLEICTVQICIVWIQ